MASATVNLPPKQKAAILLMSLPPEVSAQLFKELGPDEVHAITLEISKLPPISPDVRAQVIDEFLHSSAGSSLSDALGGGMGGMTNPMGGATQSYPPPMGGGGGGMTFTSGGGANRPLGFLRRVDPHQLLQLIRKEHPQTIAVVLSYLDPNQASNVLGELNPTTQTEVARRLAELEKISPEIVKELETILESRLHRALEEGFQPQADGKETLLEILNQADRSTEERVLSGLTQKNPHLASDIKTKLCDFDDLNNIDDGSLQQVLRLTDFRDLVLALKGANRELAERVYRFLSPEVSTALRNDVEALGQVPWDEVKQAQQQIRNILRGLVTLGKIKFR
ncbi:MAG: flagellar motor switch protein FliG [Candidatus Eremiobacteraeota bacterium]|nr:flagellar motor switch protein FliG [Candidatus Eremiobacteraeota bacterium]